MDLPNLKRVSRRPGWSRRDMIAAAALAPSIASAQAKAPPAMREMASGLRFPEGPVTYSDGSVSVVEIAGGNLTRISPLGQKTVIAHLGEGPNGCAIGPDGAAYVVKNGGLTFNESDGRMGVAGVPDPFPGGSVQRVDLKTGAVKTLYRGVEGRPFKGPNDIVFDTYGGFWFTDTGKNWPRSRDNGGLYWGRPDGSEVRELAYPLLSPNGIALAPDRRSLYVVLSPQREIVAYDIVGPGRLAMENGRLKTRVVAALGGDSGFDNIAVEEGGNIVISAVKLGLMITVTPNGDIIDSLQMPDFFPTAPAFGGPNMKTLYVTLSTTGKLMAVDWPRPGLKPLYRI